MTERKTLGDILRDFGRITEEDVQRALEHQRLRGGYFGEALLALGIVKQEELGWGLASQFDLPYVFPDADSVDPDAAAMVTPEWALAHLTLPIMRTSEGLTVVVDSPIKSEPLEELERRTGLQVRPALASGERIRELIREVYARATPADDEPAAQGLIGLPELLSRSLRAGSGRLGISARGRRAVGWYDDGGTVRRRLLTSDWEDELERLLDPPPSSRAGEGAMSPWSARLARDGVPGPVDVRLLVGPVGREYLFVTEEDGSGASDRFVPPDRELLSEVDLLVRSGAARFGVSSRTPDLRDEILPHLPGILLAPFRRAVHLTGASPPSDEDPAVFALVLPSGVEERRQALVDLRAFRFDAVTADAGLLERGLAGEILDLAGTVFLPLSSEGDRGEILDAGVRWELRVDEGGGAGDLTWSLRPLGS